MGEVSLVVIEENTADCPSGDPEAQAPTLASLALPARLEIDHNSE